MNQFVGDRQAFFLISLFMSTDEYSYFATLESCYSTPDNFMKVISFSRTSILNRSIKASVMSNAMALVCT